MSMNVALDGVMRFGVCLKGKEVPGDEPRYPMYTYIIILSHLFS